MLNNPVRYVDPTGHLGITYGIGQITFHLTHDEAVALYQYVKLEADTILTTIVGGLAYAGTDPQKWALRFLKLGMDFGRALILGYEAAMIAQVASDVATVALMIGLLGLGLAVTDAIYGSQGIDITIAPGGIPIVKPPTVSRQQGVWILNNKACDDISCLFGKLKPSK